MKVKAKLFVNHFQISGLQLSFITSRRPDFPYGGNCLPGSPSLCIRSAAGRSTNVAPANSADAAQWTWSASSARSVSVFISCSTASLWPKTLKEHDNVDIYGTSVEGSSVPQLSKAKTLHLFKADLSKLPYICLIPRKMRNLMILTYV